MNLINILKNIYRNTSVGKVLLLPIKMVKDLYWFKLYPDKKFISRRFKQKMGYELDLKNPKTLNEKIQWLKLYDRTPLHTICADKFLVRNYVKEKIGAEFLVPLVFHTDDAQNLNPTQLPEYPFIIKANHNSGAYCIVKNKDLVDWQEVRLNCSRWLKENYYPKSKEWQYKNIKPLIVVEKLLISKSGGIPFDYKVHCFHGKATMIQVDVGRQTDKHYRNWYNTRWEREPYKWSSLLMGVKTDPSDLEVERPKSLEKMIFLSERLSKEFKYVRVDWYDIDGHLYFGEVTFHHDSGFKPVEPREWDLKLGELIHLNKN